MTTAYFVLLFVTACSASFYEHLNGTLEGSQVLAVFLFDGKDQTTLTNLLKQFHLQATVWKYEKTRVNRCKISNSSTFRLARSANTNSINTKMNTPNQHNNITNDVNINKTCPTSTTAVQAAIHVVHDVIDDFKKSLETSLLSYGIIIHDLEKLITEERNENERVKKMKHQKLSSRRRKNRFRKREDSLNDGPVNNVNVENGVNGRNSSGNDTGGGNDDDDVTEELINRLLGFYPTWPEIEGWLLEVAQSFSSFVKLESIGKTFEGRDLYVLKIRPPTLKFNETENMNIVNENKNGNYNSYSTANNDQINNVTSINNFTKNSTNNNNTTNNNSINKIDAINNNISKITFTNNSTLNNVDYDKNRNNNNNQTTNQSISNTNSKVNTNVDNNNTSNPSSGNSSLYRNTTCKTILYTEVDVERPVMWLDGGVHAREWISVSSVLYIVAQILNTTNNCMKNRSLCFQNISNNNNNNNNFSNNFSNINRTSNSSKFNYNDYNLLNAFEWHIMPVVNADGYAYTFTKTSARLWRKNRGRQDGLRYSAKHNMWCQGADINRNFDFMWSNSTPHSGDLTSNDPCEETFKGPHAASENETMALQSYWLRHADVIGGYVTLHSFGQQIMNRWSYAFINDTDYYKTKPTIKRAAEEIKTFNGEEYAYGAVSEILYSFTGGSGDWIRFNLNLTHVFDIELRDKGRYGFVLPLKFVHPVAEEAWLIFQVLTSNILKNINQESRKYYKTFQKQVARVKCFATDFNETLLQTTEFSSVSIATNFPSIATTLTNAKMLLTMIIMLNLFFP